MEVNAHSEVQMAGIGNAEIVFVIDFSSSMNGQYEAVRDAAVEMITEFTDNLTATDVKIGLVPFAREVYGSMDGAYVNAGTTGTLWTNCTISRKWPWVWKDQTPTAARKSKWGLMDDDRYSDVYDSDYYDDCSNYPSRSLVIRPLTTDHAGTVAQLNAMVPYEGTNIALGIEFGQHLISSSQPFDEGVAYNNTAWSKHIILLSDGRHNKSGFGPGNEFSEEQGRENMDLICTNTKNNGVTVITIAYELDDDEGKAELEACATASRYYLEGSEETIAAVFETIGGFFESVYLSK